MKPAPFKYARPGSVDEALALLQAGGDEAKVLAGGQSFVPLLNLRMASVESIVDLNRLDDLAYIKRDNDTLCIGAMTRHRQIEVSDAVQVAQPLLCRAAAEVGHLAIRNRGNHRGQPGSCRPCRRMAPGRRSPGRPARAAFSGQLPDGCGARIFSRPHS